jgi:hypothetical protein
MLWTSRIHVLVPSALIVSLAAALGPQFATSARASCEIRDRVDNSTANQARKKFVAAGYRQVQDLRKGCDNYWHGRVMQGATQINVALSPQGQIIPEGD